MSYIIVNAYNKKIIVLTGDAVVENATEIAQKIEEDLEYGDDSGTVFDYEWYELEPRYILIKENLFEIDSNVKDELIKKILDDVNYNVHEFQKTLEKDFYIENFSYKAF